MKLIARAFVLALAVLAPVFAAAQSQDSIAGQWSAPTADPNTTPAVSLSLTVSDDNKLTGSVLLPGGVELTIQEGTVDASKVQFKTIQANGDTPVVSKWIGTVKTDEIDFSRAADDGQGVPEEIVVTRKK